MNDINAPELRRDLTNMDKPSQNPITEEEQTIQKTPRSSRSADARNSKENKLKKSKEVLLSKQTYNSPGLSSSRVEENRKSKTDEKKNKPKNISGNLEKFEIQKIRQSLPEANSTQSKEIEIASFNQSTSHIISYSGSSTSSINTSHGFRKSTDSSDGELNSDLSEDRFDYEYEKWKKHRSQEDSEDVEEKFRLHFLKTFQGMPRISQISLDEPTSNRKEKNGNKKNTQEKTNKVETSDLSDDLSDYETEKRKKHKRPEDSEDTEEKFRTHFLKTFQGMPRMSQISLDESTSKRKNENGNIRNIQGLTNKVETLIDQNEEHETDIPSNNNQDNNSGQT